MKSSILRCSVLLIGLILSQTASAGKGAKQAETDCGACQWRTSDGAPLGRSIYFGNNPVVLNEIMHGVLSTEDGEAIAYCYGECFTHESTCEASITSGHTAVCECYLLGDNN